METLQQLFQLTITAEFYLYRMVYVSLFFYVHASMVSYCKIHFVIVYSSFLLLEPRDGCASRL